jgi:ribosomal protein S18 acetylase RimI-like enzyme
VPEPADQDPAPPAWVAEAEEAEAVARLLVEFRDWHGRDWPPTDAFLSSVRRLMGNPDAEFLLAGTGDGSPPAAVGQVRYRHSVWTAADDCWIEDLFVTERARGRGLGEAVVDLAVRRARARGCRRVELDVNERNQPALSLYRRLGFEVSHKPPGGRDVLMRLPLD